MSYDGSDDDKEPKIVPIDNNNNDVNIVSDSNSELSYDDLKNIMKIFLTKMSITPL